MAAKCDHTTLIDISRGLPNLSVSSKATTGTPTGTKLKANIYMFKKIIAYLRKRNNIKLRKWCVEKSVKASRNANEAACLTEYFYGFVHGNTDG